MELISKISRGSRMDQIYIPKRRIGFSAGSFVVIRPLQESKPSAEKLFFYNVKQLEPAKLQMVDTLFQQIEKSVSGYDNIIITGSLLEKGFHFNDIDLVLVSSEKINKQEIEQLLADAIGTKVHLILIDNKTLIKGFSTDPLYQAMLSRCISRRRFVYNTENQVDYRILDLHLLKSKTLPENFDFVNGNTKYEMVRNAVSIALFLRKQRVSNGSINREIDMMFGREMSTRIKENIFADKKGFLGTYSKFIKGLSSQILEGISYGAKQE